jgi:transcriptional regulator with XRE-family HTH domain
MPRRSRTIDQESGPLALFALDLRKLRDQAPAHQQLSVDRVADLAGGKTSRASIFAALAGKRLPSRETLAAMVAAWAPDGERQLAGWMERRSLCEALLSDQTASQAFLGAPPKSFREHVTNDSRKGGDSVKAGEINATDYTSLWANEALSTWLSALRQREGITIRELAKRARMPVSSTGAYLTGASFPGKREVLERILEALNANDQEGHYAIGCWADHRIGMSPAEPPAIAPLVDDPISNRANWTTGKASE